MPSRRYYDTEIHFHELEGSSDIDSEAIPRKKSMTATRFNYEPL